MPCIVMVLTPACMKAPVGVPTLYVAGADDPIVRPYDYENTRAHFTAGMSVLTIPGGHFCHRESPVQLVPGLVAHLRGERRA